MTTWTLDAAINGTQQPQKIMKNSGTMKSAGVLHSLLYAAGTPGPGIAPTPGLAGAALTSYGGQLPFPAAVGGAECKLAKLIANASLGGSLILYDRLWHNSGIVITTTGAQTVNSVAFPARDDAGSANGAGVQVAIEVSGTTGNGAVTNTTLSYTNQSGVAGRTATIASFPAACQAGTFVVFQLQAGDTGVRSIQSLTLGTSYVSGTIHLVAFREIDMLNISDLYKGAEHDIVSSGGQRLWDNTVPCMLWLPTATTAVNIFGQFQATQA